ncbi:uncharacterized protein TNCV_1042511 [Trichonephila clavipes]|nr:uncharacterized protein TNCV_1042511 [Trichonephila clavipes]
MNKDCTPKKVFNAQLIGTRRRGRINLRWIDGLEKDLLVLRTRNWRTLAGRRLAWKRLLEKAKAHPGLCHRGRKEYISIVYFNVEKKYRKKTFFTRNTSDEKGYKSSTQNAILFLESN